MSRSRSRKTGRGRGRDDARRGGKSRGKDQGQRARSGSEAPPLPADGAATPDAPPPIAALRGRRRTGPPPGTVGEPQVAGAKVLLNPAGFAFAERTDGDGTIFIPPGNLGGAMDGDEVVVAWWPAERGPEGSVRSVVQRRRTRVTGVLRGNSRRARVEPDDPRVLGAADVVGGFDPRYTGTVVVGRIVDYPDPWSPDFTVHVEQSLGPVGSLQTEELKILVEHGIDPKLPPAVLDAAQQVPDRVRKGDRENRVDLRDLPFMTIDPPDARDFDDAVCIEMSGKDVKRAKMRVHVAVADVSHYVREGDIFDVEAARRCFTTYLPDRSVPMLPHELSSNICSLVPKRDRLAMVVSFDLDATGRVTEADVRAAVIHSRARLTYGQVADDLDGKGKLPPAVRQRVRVARAASDRLGRARQRRGTLSLNLPEIRIKLDQDDPDRVRAIEKARSRPAMGRAYNLIEELMIAANEAVARMAVRHRLPVIYRVHDVPDPDRLERLCAVADLLGLPADPDKVGTPKGMAAFLRKVAKHPRRDALASVVLRSLAQAEYDPKNMGHFALASGAYLHFTSPIRRYPDLVCHRALKAWLARREGPSGVPIPRRMPSAQSVRAHAEQSSQRERASVQAERDAKALFTAHYMRDRVGDRFEGTISGLSGSGVFVTLDDPPVDGMIKRALVERETRRSYQLDELGARLVASKNGRDLTIGDRVIIEVIDASTSRRQIDFALMGILGTGA